MLANLQKYRMAIFIAVSAVLHLLILNSEAIKNWFLEHLLHSGAHFWTCCIYPQFAPHQCLWTGMIKLIHYTISNENGSGIKTIKYIARDIFILVQSDLGSGVHPNFDGGRVVFAGDNGGDMDIIVYDLVLDQVVDAGDRLVARYPAMERSESAGGFASLYAVTPDWHPIVDEVPAGSGFYLCTGFSGHGFKLGPAVGRMLADFVTGAPDPLFDPRPFRLSRYAENAPFTGQYEYSIVG